MKTNYSQTTTWYPVDNPPPDGFYLVCVARAKKDGTPDGRYGDFDVRTAWYYDDCFHLTQPYYLPTIAFWADVPRPPMGISQYNGSNK